MYNFIGKGPSRWSFHPRRLPLVVILFYYDFIFLSPVAQRKSPTYISVFTALLPPRLPRHILKQLPFPKCRQPFLWNCFPVMVASISKKEKSLKIRDLLRENFPTPHRYQSLCSWKTSTREIQLVQTTTKNGAELSFSVSTVGFTVYVIFQHFPPKCSFGPFSSFSTFGFYFRVFDFPARTCPRLLSPNGLGFQVFSKSVGEVTELCYWLVRVEV